MFYKFKSQKDESRINFDGTGISVFDLKKEVILSNNLGKANDFDLVVYDSSSNDGTRFPLLTETWPSFAQSTRMIRTSSPAQPLLSSSVYT